MSEGNIVLKQMHARIGHEEQASRIIIQKLDDDAGWIEL